MNSLVVAGLLIVLLGLSYQSGWARGRTLASAGGVKVHSRPQYHGAYVAIWTMLPALVILGLWAVFGPGLTRSYLLSQFPADMLASLSADDLRNTINRVTALASGYGVVGDV